MQKKNFLLKMFLFICVTAVVFSVGGCAHTHTASTDWGATSAEHFHICTKLNCSEIMDVGEHEFGEFSTYQAPTCTKSGSKSRECSVCGYTNWVTINPLGHNFGTSQDVKFEFKKDQTTTGENYWLCTATRNCIRCEEFETETISTLSGKLTAREIFEYGCGQDEVATFTNPQFENAAFNQAFAAQNIRDVVTKKHTQEHNFNYNNITYTWAADYSYCLASVVCQNANCGVKVEEYSVSVSSDYHKATCTEGDYTIYTATFDSPLFPPKQITVLGENAALGHTYSTATYTWSSDHRTCTANNTCTTCNQNFSATATLNGTGDFVKYFEQQQTCFQNGFKKYVATFENSAAFPQTEEYVERTEALKHEWGEVQVTWTVNDGIASCTATVHCTREVNNTTCSGTYSYTISNITGVAGSDGKMTYTADFTTVDGLGEEYKTLFDVRTYTPEE